MSRKKLYALWILAFLFKIIGASWDVSYHFKYLREFYQLPHILNGLGDLIGLILLIYMIRTESKREREGIKIIALGMLIFIFGVGFDQWYHATFGLDLTIWSPAHITLYLGSAFVILGMIFQTLHDHRNKILSSRTTKTYLLIFFFFLFESFWFLLLQQEQGIIASYLFAKGTPLVSQELLLFLKNPELTISGGIPAWVYAAWSCFSAMFIFSLVKYFKLNKFSATYITSAYLIFRIIMNIVFSAVAYQTSTIPYNLLLTAIIFDLLYFYLEKLKVGLVLKASLLSIAVTLSIYSISLINIKPPIHPLMPLNSMGYAIIGALLAFILARIFFKVLPKVEEFLDR